MWDDSSHLIDLNVAPELAFHSFAFVWDLGTEQ